MLRLRSHLRQGHPAGEASFESAGQSAARLFGFSLARSSALLTVLSRDRCLGLASNTTAATPQLPGDFAQALRQISRKPHQTAVRQLNHNVLGLTIVRSLGRSTGGRGMP